MSTTAERGDRDLEEYVRNALDDRMSQVWTSAPGIVKGYDAAKQTVSVQLSIKSTQRMPDGSVKFVSIPVLQDVPVQFPGAGGMKMTFPVKVGDECLVNFSCRSPDSWQQSGGEQAPVDAGMHSLSNGFAMLGFSSNPEAKKLQGGADPDAVQIRSADGQTAISLKGGETHIKAPGADLTVSSSLIKGDVGGTLVKITGGRVDLGGEGGAQVVTLSGPSSIVYAKV